MTDSVVNATGVHWVITRQTDSGYFSAVVTEVAASLHAFTVDGVDIVQRYATGAAPSRGAGIIMSPWPNRIDGGRWLYDGEVQQLDITDTEFSHACHGLLRYEQYRLHHRSDSTVTLSSRIYPHPGYPFTLETLVRYSLTDEGLEVRHTFTNIGSRAAPVAVGSHGYYTLGDVATGDLVLTVSAETVYTADSRMIPITASAVRDVYDLRLGRSVREINFDDCFTDQKLRDGRYSAELTAPDGRSVTVWGDSNFDHLVICTTKLFLNERQQFVDAIAIEPQTAAVNSFNNQIGLKWLEPNEVWSPTWGVTARL